LSGKELEVYRPIPLPLHELEKYELRSIPLALTDVSEHRNMGALTVEGYAK
jgi:hypothetical protein